MTELLKEIGKKTLAVAQIGVILGGISGILALLFAESREPLIIGDYAASYFPILIVTLPLGLLGVFLSASEENDTPLFKSGRQALIIMVFSGLLGGLLGGLFSVIVTQNVIAIFGGVEIIALSQALTNSIGRMNFVYTTLATGLVGLIAALWYQYKI